MVYFLFKSFKILIIEFLKKYHSALEHLLILLFLDSLETPKPEPPVSDTRNRQGT